MEPENNRFGGGSPETLLHPFVALMMVLAIILILVLPRKYVSVPLLLVIILIPKSQVLMIAGVHFTVSRILFIVGLVRWIGVERLSPLAGGFTAIDRLFACWAFFCLSVFSLQWLEAQAFIKASGEFLDAIGGYFVLRFAVKTKDDVMRVIRVMGAIAVICAVVMVREQMTGTNLFGYLGGMPIISRVRDEHIRSQAGFGVFITAGTFGATLLPLLVYLWSDVRLRVGALLSIIGATAMMLTCHASTTLLSYVAGVAALLLWPFRREMRVFRWGIVVTAVLLHLVMNGPVWSLIQKVDLTGSSSSHHRYMLVDNCIRHFSDWWLLGSRNYHTWGWSMWDLANQYVAYAVTGGLVTITCFIGIICKAFTELGIARRRFRYCPNDQWLVWCLGSALFSHVVSYFGVGYFDQMQFAWFALLASICAITAKPRDIGRQKAPVTDFLSPAQDRNDDVRSHALSW